MSEVFAVMEADFEVAISAADPVLVEFYSDWCPPCRALDPILDALAVTFASRLQVVKVNIVSAPYAAERNGVTTTPTLVLFSNGSDIGRRVGASSHSALEAWIRDILRE